jgi:hypothetical protein
MGQKYPIKPPSWGAKAKTRLQTKAREGGRAVRILAGRTARLGCSPENGRARPALEGEY